MRCLPQALEGCPTLIQFEWLVGGRRVMQLASVMQLVIDGVTVTGVEVSPRRAR